MLSTLKGMAISFNSKPSYTSMREDNYAFHTERERNFFK